MRIYNWKVWMTFLFLIFVVSEFIRGLPKEDKIFVKVQMNVRSMQKNFITLTETGKFVKYLGSSISSYAWARFTCSGWINVLRNLLMSKWALGLQCVDYTQLKITHTVVKFRIYYLYLSPVMASSASSGFSANRVGTWKH